MYAPWGPLQAHRGVAARIYGGAAVLLVPWIVVLAATQQPEGVAHHVRALSFIAAVSIGAALVVAAASASERVATMAVTAAIAGAFASTWFQVISVSPWAERPRIVVSLVVLVVAFVAGGRAVRALVDQTDAPWRRPVLGAAALVLASAARALAVAPVVAPVSHLRLAWVGLDVMELAGLASTSWALHRDSPAAVVAGTFTGTLLGFDALVNIVATTGAAQVTALVMCLAEVPLAAGGFLIAWWAPPRARAGHTARSGARG